MAAEDFTSASWNSGTPQADEGAKFTVIAGKVSWVEYGRDETSYFYSDKTAGHFAGDFEHLLEIEQANQLNNCKCLVWCISNTIGESFAVEAANGDTINCQYYAANLYMQENNTGSQVNGDKSYALTGGQERWLKIKRVEGGTSYVYCYIYDSAARDNLVDTITLTLSEDQDFRYIFAPMGSDDASVNQTADGYIKDLDLQEGAPPAGSPGAVFYMDHFNGGFLNG